MVSGNVPTGKYHGAPKHGDALLAGLIRCRRCGRKLTLRYSGTRNHIPRYSCNRAWMDNGSPHCSASGGLRVDDAIEEALRASGGARWCRPRRSVTGRPTGGEAAFGMQVAPNFLCHSAPSPFTLLT
ncbi:zinc ribbon domain-containing protein [Bradyrhizobium japonicum]|uniref:zinc ribbon domain-containing protein n=1 Tax=Bradyrhizobium japonicum TaxID=375 RepID=UPI001FDA1946|nr:zinc ribbon domain-containing protein [Bradyrhizobium japonicum]WLB93019.1 zinc ribbon domain-containing protein [Bradyrhizobium japonicum USDA 135]